MKRLISILFASLMILTLPVCVFAAPASESNSGTSVKLTPFPAEKIDEMRNISELTAGKYTAKINLDNESGVIENTVLQYEGKTLFEGGAELISSLGNDVYIYADGKLNFYDKDGVASTLFTFADSYKCVIVNEAEGKRYAVFLDSTDRSLYIHNLTDGTVVTGDLSDYYIGFGPVGKDNLFNDVYKIGDCFVFLAVYDIDTAEMLDRSLILKQEGDKLEIFTPDVSNPANANSGGEELALFEYQGKWGYINSDGRVVALYEDATDFSPNGAAFVRDGEYGYFVDKKLNRISEPLDFYRSSYVYGDVFELFTDTELTQNEYYTVTFEPAGNPEEVPATETEAAATTEATPEPIPAAEPAEAPETLPATGAAPQTGQEADGAGNYIILLVVSLMLAGAVIAAMIKRKSQSEG